MKSSLMRDSQGLADAIGGRRSAAGRTACKTEEALLMIARVAAATGRGLIGRAADRSSEFANRRFLGAERPLWRESQQQGQDQRKECQKRGRLALQPETRQEAPSHGAMQERCADPVNGTERRICLGDTLKCCLSHLSRRGPRLHYHLPTRLREASAAAGVCRSGPRGGEPAWLAPHRVRTPRCRAPGLVPENCQAASAFFVRSHAFFNLAERDS